MDKVYDWRGLVNNKYEPFLGLESDWRMYKPSNSDSIDSRLYPLCKSFLSTYNSFKIPLTIESKLNELFLRFDLVRYKPHLLIIGCALQQSYSDNYEIIEDDLLNDFDIEFKDFNSLLKILKIYLFSENLKNLPNITFRTLMDGNISIKNFFVKHDIYKALCHAFDLTIENFHERSKELLKMNNNVIVASYPEKVKVDFIQNIYSYLIEINLRRADALRFIGVFFKFFQVEINNKETEFFIFETLDDNIKSINIKNINNYIARPPKLFHF